MAASTGGRDHPTNWALADGQSNIWPKNDNIVDQVNALVDGNLAQYQQDNGAKIPNPRLVNDYPLTDRAGLERYQQLINNVTRRRRLKDQVKHIAGINIEGEEIDPQDIQAMNTLLDGDPSTWYSQEKPEEPPAAEEPPPPPPRAPRPRRGQQFNIEQTKYVQMPVLAESFMNFRYSYIQQLVEEKDVWIYQDLHESGGSAAKFYRAALAKKGYEFDANDNVVGIDEARYHIKQAQDKKQEIEGKGKDEKDEKEKGALRKQYRAWDRLEKSETEYYNRYGDTIKARGAADKRKQEEPDDKPMSYYKRPPITDAKTLEIIKKLRAKGMGKK